LKRRRFLRRVLERLWVTEVIGQDECPLMLRWTIVKLPFGKLMIHHFPPNVTDRDPHDHPSPFISLILKGGYFNIEWIKVDLPGQEHMAEVEWLGRGRLVLRRAKHMHITETSDQGAWTLVLMGPKTRREWGFLRLADDKWWEWKAYVERWGGVVRCDTGELDEEQPGEYAPYRLYKGTHPAQ
jgi:hypothetical protein